MKEKGLANIDKAAEAGYWLAQFDQAAQYDEGGHRDVDFKKACEGFRAVSKLGYTEGIIVWHSTTSRVLAKNGM